MSLRGPQRGSAECCSPGKTLRGQGTEQWGLRHPHGIFHLRWALGAGSGAPQAAPPCKATPAWRGLPEECQLMDKARALGRTAGPRKPQKSPRKALSAEGWRPGQPQPGALWGSVVPVPTGVTATLALGWAPHNHPIHPWGGGKALAELEHPGGPASPGRGFQAGAAISGG